MLKSLLGDIGRYCDGDHAASYFGVQHIVKHPGPLGVFFRWLARKKNRNVAVAAVARKLVTIAYLMLKNNEPDRYAVAKRVHEKFTGLKFTATGKSGRLKSCDVPRDLPAACATHALPPVRHFDGLAAGE